MSSKKWAIPDRWLDYEAVGKQIDGTPFVAFKVPLRNSFNDDISPQKEFTPSDLIKTLPNLALVIDLTNTEKYYSRNEFLEKGVGYEKIFCPGHAIPPKFLVKKFFDIVDDFVRSKSDSDQVCLIGVHCTHGINRTGFFICSYMINKMGYDSEKAISEFNTARGHHIERENYLRALKNYDIHPLTFPVESNVEYSNRKFRNGSYCDRRMPGHSRDRCYGRVNDVRISRGYRNQVQNSEFFRGPRPRNDRFHSNFPVESHYPQSSYQSHQDNFNRALSDSSCGQRYRVRGRQPPRKF